METEELLARARHGDGDAFRQLVEPDQQELHVHCYRMLGSLQDAEDALQETLLAAWRGLDGFEGRSSLRAWLYRIATNRCLNVQRAVKRRPAEERSSGSGVELPEPSRWVEQSWLEPYPDALLDSIPDAAPGPDARYESKEAISLAFVAAMQVLSPRQRAALVLRDVLGFRASEVADILGTSEDSVTSALKRARAALAAELPRDRGALPDAPRERELAARFAAAFERGDTDAILVMLADDAWLRMPPLPVEYQGAAAVANFLAVISFRGDRRYRLVPTRANGQPAYGCYLCDPQTSTARAYGLLVITLSGGKVSAITRFLDNSLLMHFGLPRILPD